MLLSFIFNVLYFFCVCRPPTSCLLWLFMTDQIMFSRFSLPSSVCVQDESGVVGKLFFKVSVLWIACIARTLNSSLKKKGINDYAAQCCAVADVPSSTRIPFAPSTLSEPTATLRCCAVRFTWLENGNTMNQRLYVQRPSVLTGCFIWLIMQRGKKTKASHTNTPLYPQPYSSETLMLQTNADGIRDNFLRKWILQMFSGFLLCWRGAVGRLVRCVSAPSLPPVYSCISIACFLTRS